MHFENELDQRIAMEFEKRKVVFETKKMFGGVCFLVKEKMCVGSMKNLLMVRFDPVIRDEILKREGARFMDFSGRPMKGFVFIDEYGIETDEALGEWIDLALEYNPRAKASKKKSKK